MDIKYKNKNLRKICTNANVARKEYGANMAKKIHQRIDELTAADCIDILIQCHIGRCHSLQGNRKGQYATDLVHPYRLIFTLIDDKIQVIEVQEIIDYH